MARPEKEKTVEELTELLKRAKGVVLSDFTGLNAEEMTVLRRRCRESSVQYVVAKNTLAKFAATKADLESLHQYLVGTNGFTFGYDDPMMPAKVISDFAKESEKLRIRAGIFDGEVFGGDEVKRIAMLPGRDILLSQVLSQLGAPISRFTEVLRSVLRQFVYALGQVRDKMPSEPAQAAPAVAEVPEAEAQPAVAPEEKASEGPEEKTEQP
jgi:large subunit ribosomal protein L10